MNFSKKITKWENAQVKNIINEHKGYLLLELQNGEKGCIHKDRVMSDKKYYELNETTIKLRFLRNSTLLNMKEYTCEKYFTKSIIKMQPTGRVIYESTNYNASRDIKGYIFKDEYGKEHFFKSIFLLGKTAQKLLKDKKDFRFIVQNNDDENDYSQIFNLISPYFITLEDLNPSSSIKNFIYNTDDVRLSDIKNKLNDYNSLWILSLDNLLSGLRSDVYKNKNFSLLAELYEFHINVIDYINNSGFLYTIHLRNKPNESLSKKDLIKNRQNEIKAQIQKYKSTINNCLLYSNNKLLYYLEKNIKKIPELIKNNKISNIIEIVHSMIFYANRIEDKDIEFDENLILLYTQYFEKIEKSSFYDDKNSRPLILTPFITLKKFVRKMIFKSDIISNEFEGSPYLKFFILCTKIDFLMIKLQNSDISIITANGYLLNSDIFRFRAYYEKNKTKKFELLNSAFNTFQFDENINNVNIPLPLDNTKKYYREIFLRCSKIFENMSLLEENIENKIEFLKTAITFNKRAHSPRGFYLQLLIEYLKFYYYKILTEKNITLLVEESKKYLNQFNEYINESNSPNKFMDSYPATKQFKITYELISLINKKDKQSIDYIYKILSEELNSLNSNLSSINNLKLAKLIISNNLLIDISDSNKSLHEDIFQFLRKGFINENKAFGIGDSYKKLIKSIMLEIVKGEGIDIEFKSTLCSFQHSKNNKYQIIKFGPRTKFNNNNIATLEFLKSINSFMNTKEGGVIYLGISEDKETPAKIHGIETDGYKNNDDYNAIIDRAKDFIPNVRLGGTRYITINSDISKSFNIPFDPKPKLKKFIRRTICEVIIKGYDNNPHLSELKYLNKDGNEKVEYYKKTIHGDKLLTVSDVNKFHLTNSKI